MVDDYYEPHARLALIRAFVLVGHPGSGVHQVGRAIAGRTGLAFNDVERLTEAVAGRSRARIAAEQGIPRLRALERAALEKALRRTPYGIVVMESALLEDEDVGRLLGECSSTLYLRRPFETLLARIRALVARAPGSLPDFPMGTPDSAAQLEGYLSPRAAALSGCDWVLEAGDRHPMRLAKEIVAGLDELARADARER